MKRFIIAYIAGLIFGLGISISGMGNPAKVLNFFDIAGTWDASLIFVMGGALVTTFIGYHFIFQKTHPIMDQKFHLPTIKNIDWRLISGSVIFGIGWGIAGFCPGGALPMLGTLRLDVILFTSALIAGIYLAKWLSHVKMPKAKKADL